MKYLQVLKKVVNIYVSIKLFKSANLDKIKRNYGEKLFVSRPKSKKPRKRRVKTRNKK